MSLVYRYRQQHSILTSAIEELRGVLDSRASRESRARVTRRLREWQAELSSLELSLAERLAELEMARLVHMHATQETCYIDQYFMTLLQLEIDKEDRWLAGFRARKKSTIQHYSAMD